jgi:hypothetical protein
MSIKDIIVDTLMKTSLFEMAFSKSEAIKKTSDLQFEIARHMIKIYMYRNSIHVNHWCNELNSWFHRIQDHKLKGTKKPLAYKDLYHILFEQPLESVEEVQSHMNKIYSQYKDLYIDQPDSRVIHSTILNVLHYICLEISRDKFMDIRDYL